MAIRTAVYPNPPYFRNGRAVESRSWYNRLNALVQKLTARKWEACRDDREYRRNSLLLMRAYALTPAHFAYSNVGEKTWTEYLLQDARIRYAAVKAECEVS